MKNLRGKRFGRLLAVRPLEKRDHHGCVIWLCRCDCGSQAEAPGTRLISGEIVSCGCRREETRGELHDRLTFVDGTCVETIGPRKARSDSKTGFRGVSIQKRRYRAIIGFQRKVYYLGSFSTFEEAKKARLEAETLIHRGFVRAWDAWQRRVAEEPGIEQEENFVFEVTQAGRELLVHSPILDSLEEGCG